MAVNDDVVLGVELPGSVLELPEGNELRALDSAYIVFVGFADVDQHHFAVALPDGAELLYGYLFYLRLFLLHFLFSSSDAAESLVVYKLRHRGTFPAHGAFRILSELENPGLHLENVQEKKPSYERVSFSDHELHHFRGLHRADHSGQYSQHASLGAARHESRGRGLGVETPVAGASSGVEDAYLSLEPENASVNVGNPEKDAGVVREIPGGEVVRSVDDDIVVPHDVHRVRGAQPLVVGDDVHVGIELQKTVPRGFHLRLPDGLFAVQHLPLQVAEVHHVEIQHSQGADSGRRQVESERRSEPARADAQNSRVLEFLLTLESHLRHYQVAAVPGYFLVAQVHFKSLPFGIFGFAPRAES